MQTQISLFNSLVLMLSLLACGSVRVYDVPKVQDSIGVTLQKTEEVVQKAQTDLREKKALLENLTKSGTPAFKEVESDLRRGVERMNSAFESLSEQRKIMMQAKDDASQR
jgi:hypothetical protein